MTPENIYIHYRKSWWVKLKRDLAERLLKFETFNGAFILIPWGWGFFYYGFPWDISLDSFWYVVQQPQFGYNYGFMSSGIVIMVWGIRKVLVNRVKQKLKMEESVALRRAL